MYEGQIENGMKALDEKIGPTWLDKVDEGKLIMSTCWDCLVGQLFGSYAEGLEALQLPERGTYYGFALDAPFTHGYDYSWEALTQEWRQAIKARKAERGPIVAEQ